MTLITGAVASGIFAITGLEVQTNHVSYWEVIFLDIEIVLCFFCVLYIMTLFPSFRHVKLLNNIRDFPQENRLVIEQFLTVYHIYASFWNTLQLQLKQALHLLNLQYFIVLIHKCTNLQEKDYSQYPIAARSVCSRVSALEKNIPYRYVTCKINICHIMAVP